MATRPDDQATPLEKIFLGLRDPLTPISLATGMGNLEQWARKAHRGPNEPDVRWAPAMSWKAYLTSRHTYPAPMRALHAHLLGKPEWPERWVCEMFIDGALIGRVFWVALGEQQLVIAILDSQDKPIPAM